MIPSYSFQLVIFVQLKEHMSLIKSVSGIRGTLGGTPGENLTPKDIVAFATGYAAWLRTRFLDKNQWLVIIGRDARPSGPMVAGLVAHTLAGCGIQVKDLGLSTTPTVEMAVPAYGAQGGIILTASHNPVAWNALKLLNEKGEFLSAEDGEALLALTSNPGEVYQTVEKMGQVTQAPDFIDEHIEAILALPLVRKDLIEKAGFSISIDAVNSSGGIAIPKLLKALGVKTIDNPYGEPHGIFPHNPEPLPEHLQEFFQRVKEVKADLGIVVDPDVDRLAFVAEDGSFFGEEYTLVAVADYVLSKTPGTVVSNLSSSRALQDIAEKYGQKRFTSAVGEVHVVRTMKKVNAVLGGEGNGGIILPELHYGRDALVGVALFLSHLAEKKCTVSELRNQYPTYHMAKLKVDLAPGLDVDGLLNRIAAQYAEDQISREDGVWIDQGTGWVHLRKSNTEPIIRIYTESKTMEAAQALGESMRQQLLQS